MPVEVTPVETTRIDDRAMQVFLKAIELVGGPRGLIEHRRLTWLPSLMEAAYAIVLREEHKKPLTDIAQFLGISSNAAKLMLSAPTEAVIERIKGESPDDTRRFHIAGGLAKLAYEKLKSSSTEKSEVT